MCSAVFGCDMQVISMLGLMSGEYVKACGTQRTKPLVWSFIRQYVSGGFGVRQLSSTYASYLTGV